MSVTHAIECPSCGMRLKIPQGVKATAKVSCKKCHNVFRVAEAATAAKQPAAQEPDASASTVARASGDAVVGSSKTKWLLSILAFCTAAACLLAISFFASDGPTLEQPSQETQPVSRSDSESSGELVVQNNDLIREAPSVDQSFSKPPAKNFPTVQGEPLEFVEDVVLYRLSGSAFRPMKFGYPLAEGTPPIFMGGHDGVAWRFPNKVEESTVLLKKMVLSDYAPVAMPYAQLWVWKEPPAEFSLVPEGVRRPTPSPVYDPLQFADPYGNNSESPTDKRNRLSPPDTFEGDELDLRNATPDDRIVSDVIFDGTRVLQLGERGELKVLGEWKAEFWDQLFQFAAASLDDAPEFMREKLQQEHYQEQFEEVQSSRDSSHLWLEAMVVHKYLEQEEGAKLLKNDRESRQKLDSPEAYPWGRIGVVRLGNTFFGFSACNSRQAAYVVNLATGKIDAIDNLFGVGVGYVSPQLLSQQGFNGVLSATSEGLICQVPSQTAPGQADYVRVSLDGSRTTLATEQPPLRRFGQVEECSVVAEIRDKTLLKMGTLYPNGLVQWLNLDGVDAAGVNTIRVRHYGVLGEQWIATLVAPDNKYHEIGIEFDRTNRELVESWHFHSPLNHIKYSRLKPHQTSRIRSTFQADGKSWFVAGDLSEFSVFDGVSGDLQDVEKRQGEFTEEGSASIFDLSREQALIEPNWNAEGAPEFSAFDCDRWVWRTATLGTKTDWQKVTRVEKPKWSPLLHTKYGVWLASPALAEDGRLEHVLIFASTNPRADSL